MTERLKPGYICTFKKHMFNPLKPDPEKVDIEDIAHALSMTCRYSGHCEKFYSVAEHSVAVAILVERWTNDTGLAMQALLHDASEAYLTDIPSPVKPFLPKYREFEKALMDVILTKYELPTTIHEMVKKADATLLFAEEEVMIHAPYEGWGLGFERYQPSENEKKMAQKFIVHFTPKEAEDEFLQAFYYYYHTRGL